jgi:hypothetical protein
MHILSTGPIIVALALWILIAIGLGYLLRPRSTNLGSIMLRALVLGVLVAPSIAGGHGLILGPFILVVPYLYFNTTNCNIPGGGDFCEKIASNFIDRLGTDMGLFGGFYLVFFVALVFYFAISRNQQ